MTAVCAFIGLAEFCATVFDWSHIIPWILLWFGVVVISWFVGWYFRRTRPYCGFVVFVLGAFIIGIVKGIKDQKARDSARASHPQVRPQPQPQPTIPFGWLWEWR